MKYIIGMLMISMVFVSCGSSSSSSPFKYQNEDGLELTLEGYSLHMEDESFTVYTIITLEIVRLWFSTSVRVT